MYRSMKKAIEDYNRKFYNRSGNEGAFYLSDGQQILDMSENHVELVFNALEAGFMIGYRKGRREAKKVK